MNTYKRLKNKILTKNELDDILLQIREKGLTIGFTNGCFDILHKGHIHYLADASDLADVFIIGLNTDSSVKRLKGPNRPLQDQESRAISLSALVFIDYVVMFGEDTPLELLKIIRPNMLVKGGDYQVETIVGYDLVTSYGGKVITLPLVKGYSTTSIIKKISSGNL
jgi:D-glycero-beta-D-manno-heptose 1-phosphate adenylyltransferase